MTIGIHIDGGLIQSIGVLDLDGPNMAVIVDYDTDGADPDDLTEVPQPDGTTIDAYIHLQVLQQWPDDATTQWYLGYTEG